MMAVGIDDLAMPKYSFSYSDVKSLYIRYVALDMLAFLKM